MLVRSCLSLVVNEDGKRLRRGRLPLQKREKGLQWGGEGVSEAAGGLQVRLRYRCSKSLGLQTDIAGFGLLLKVEWVNNDDDFCHRIFEWTRFS